MRPSLALAKTSFLAGTIALFATLPGAAQAQDFSSLMQLRDQLVAAFGDVDTGQTPVGGPLANMDNSEATNMIMNMVDKASGGKNDLIDGNVVSLLLKAITSSPEEGARMIVEDLPAIASGGRSQTLDINALTRGDFDGALSNSPSQSFRAVPSYNSSVSRNSSSSFASRFSSNRSQSGGIVFHKPPTRDVSQ